MKKKSIAIFMTICLILEEKWFGLRRGGKSQSVMFCSVLSVRAFLSGSSNK